MLVIRPKTVVNLPLGSVIASLVFVPLLVRAAGLEGATLSSLAPLLVLEALFVIMAAAQLRVTRRSDDQVRVYGCFAPVRREAAAVELRASARGTRSPVLDVELHPKHGQAEVGVSVAILGASDRGRAQAQSVAEALGLPIELE